MNWFLRGALSLVLAASAGAALAQAYGPPPAGYPQVYDPPLAGGPGHMRAPQFRDDMPGPDRRAGYDVSGYDREGYDAYGFDHGGYTRDGYDLYGYDEHGLDRYGRPAPPRYVERDRDYRDGPQGRGYDERYAHEERYAGGGDRYGPRDYWDEPADAYYVPSFGGALQHYADPRCNTCRTPVRFRDCGCTSSNIGALTLGSDMFYDYGGVGPIPDGGYYGGGGGFVVMSGAGARSSASAHAFASSSSHVSVRVGGGHKGGCSGCGGGHH